MRRGIRDFAEIVSRVLPILEPIYEFGAWQAQPQGFSDMRSFFPGKKYVGCDIRQGPGVDVIMDLHRTELPSESVGTILMLETLEHVQFPMKAMEQANRILKPNGTILISSQMNYPIHDTHDYWRFTPEGFLTLLEDYPLKLVESAGDASFPPAVVGIGMKGQVPPEIWDELRGRMGEWKDSWLHGGAAQSFEEAKPGWRRFVKPFTPPIVVDLYRKLKA